MLNGSPHGFFKSNRGMRQEDPLSPCFFVLVMKFWSITMDIAIASGDISPLRKNGKMVVFHLLFADDMLVYCKGDRRSGNGLNFALQILEWYIGLVINKGKNKVFFSKGCCHKEDIADILGVSSGQLPIRFLGVPLTRVYP